MKSPYFDAKTVKIVSPSELQATKIINEQIFTKDQFIYVWYLG
jgi:hypothetical protein